MKVRVERKFDKGGEAVMEKRTERRTTKGRNKLKRIERERTIIPSSLL